MFGSLPKGHHNPHCHVRGSTICRKQFFLFPLGKQYFWRLYSTNPILFMYCIVFLFLTSPLPQVILDNTFGNSREMLGLLKSFPRFVVSYSSYRAAGQEGRGLARKRSQFLCRSWGNMKEDVITRSTLPLPANPGWAGRAEVWIPCGAFIPQKHSTVTWHLQSFSFHPLIVAPHGIFSIKVLRTFQWKCFSYKCSSCLGFLVAGHMV